MRNTKIKVLEGEEVLMDDGTMQHRGFVHTRDENYRDYENRDTWKANIAGYELAKILQLKIMPPYVETKLNGRPASVSWYLDDVIMDEAERSQRNVQPPDLEAFKVHPLRRNISVLEGSGGNIAVLTGKDGKLVIDAGFTVSKPRIAPALDSLSADPISQLINTHWHVDHTDGNAWLHAAGAAITAHENTKKHLSTSTRVDDWSYTFPPARPEALPTTTFRDVHRLHHNDTALALEYYGPAHTDSDISVVFDEADVIHVGDTWWNGFYPFIDYSTGGGIDGMIRATKWNLSAVTDKTIIIPGHGPEKRRRLERQGPGHGSVS
jgi:glyoxylase-like metal-dependent hydrolase (beta-lactamase superfamily II)